MRSISVANSSEGDIMPKKQQHSIKLYGYIDHVTKAKTHNADKVVLFRNDINSIRIKRTDEESDNLTMFTHKGSYLLVPHPNQNIYTAIINGVKVHFSKRKIVGELRFWN